MINFEFINYITPFGTCPTKYFENGYLPSTAIVQLFNTNRRVFRNKKRVGTGMFLNVQDSVADPDPYHFHESGSI